jgi:Flp pilus assembly protein TadG
MKSKFRFLSLLSRFGKDKQASGPRLWARLLRDEEGSYLLIMTLAIPVFIGLAGLATEGALLFYNHRTVQSAADAAAYSAAVAYSIDSSADITTQAQAIVANYGFVVGTSNNQANVVATVDTTTYSPLTAINVTVTRPQLPILSGIWVNNPFNVSGSAKAVISGGAGGGNGNCILGLAPTGTAITLQGNVNVSAAPIDRPWCGIFSNSSISLGGTASITAGSVGAAGSVSVGGNANIGPPPNGYTSGDNPVINPYAGTTVPTPGTCIDGPAPGVGNNPTAPLNPGTYCNPISCTGSCPSVTLNPGTYILKNSQLIVQQGAALTGNGVTLVFTDPGGAAYPNGSTAMDIRKGAGATINLQAPAADATLGIPGMLILGDTNMPTSTNFTLSANGVGISGVIYLPDGNFTWGGGPIIAGGCTQMIAYRVTLEGDAIFNNSNCDLSGGGGGGAKPIGNVVTLVK